MSEKENKNKNVATLITSLTSAAFNFGVIASEHKEHDIEYINALKLVRLEQEALLKAFLIRIKIDS